jgi:hypothetical protein
MAPLPCTYCSDPIGNESEHVFPASWYPDSTPPEVQRLTVPSCKPCNTRWKKVEEGVAQELLLVVDPTRSEIAGAHERLSRAWLTQGAKNERDRKHRHGKAQKILKTMAWVPTVQGRPRVTVRMPSGIVVPRAPARSIENEPIRLLSEKFIRGLHYAETGARLEGVGFQALLLHGERQKNPAESLQAVLTVLGQLPIDQSLGPGFWFRRHHESSISVWAFLIWGQVTIIAFARRHEDGTLDPIPEA